MRLINGKYFDSTIHSFPSGLRILLFLPFGGINDINDCYIRLRIHRDAYWEAEIMRWPTFSDKYILAAYLKFKTCGSGRHITKVNPLAHGR